MNNFYRNPGYGNGKAKRAEDAKHHADEMERRFPDEIRSSVSEAVIYGPEMPEETGQTGAPSFLYEDSGTSDAAIRHASDGRTAVLNFASYRYPGGGFLSGAMAQEEAICHDSDLYNVLSRLPDFYAYNDGHRNRSLYTDRALWTPGIVFGKNGKTASVDVITCAAPNFTAAEKYGHVRYRENLEVLKKRALFLRRILEKENVQTAILGAWGCGVFGQRPEDVASTFLGVFADSTIKTIVFAVPSAGRGKANADAFRSACMKVRRKS